MKIVPLFLLLQMLTDFFYSQAQFNIELNQGTARSCVDLILYPRWREGSPWSLFIHDRAVVYNTDHRTGFLTINSAIYNFSPSTGVTANLIGDNTHFYTSAGIQWEHTGKKWYFYILSTYAFALTPYQEDYLFIIYQGPVTKKLNFVFHQEYYFSWSRWQNDQSLQRIKIGLQKEGIQFGILQETYQTGSKWNSALKNWGLYIKRSF